MADWKDLLAASHPIWKVAQGLVSVSLLLVLVTHGMGGSHAGGLDGEDLAGMGGIALAARLAWQWLKR